MAILDTILAWISFVLVCIVANIAPWLFGAWEMWWFWPFAVCIFAASFCFALRLVLGGSLLRTHRLRLSPAGTTTAVGFTVFLAYAFVRAGQSPVYMDAERSLMLFVTPFLLAGVIVIGFSRPQLLALHALVFLNLLCLGLYGIVNHWLTNSRRVLWVITEYRQYAGRASGTYFCPDHYSFLMELLLGLALGLLLTAGNTANPGSGKRTARAWNIAAGMMIPVSLCGVWLSQSRGGGLTVLAVLTVSILLWTSGFRPAFRRGIRLGGLVACVVGIAILWHSGNTYVSRFKEFFPAGGSPAGATVDEMVERIKSNSRYGMYSAALRAWREIGPWFGIGPGMHQHIWFHYAASPDGDRDRGIWPARPNAEAHSYQVHNDWLQLLEEYGITGTAVFLVAACSLLLVLVRGFRSGIAPAITLGAIMCFTCAALHSLVDFSLQIPATAWLFAVILSIPFALIERDE